MSSHEAAGVTPIEIEEKDIRLPYERGDGPPEGSQEEAASALKEMEPAQIEGEDDDEAEDFDEPLEDDEDEFEDDEEEEFDDEEGDEPELDDTRAYKVTVDGEEVEVTLGELLNGYSRQSDYTRKTQALADQRRQVEQAGQQAMMTALAFQQQVEALAMTGHQLTPQQQAAYVQAKQYEASQHYARTAETLQTEKALLVEAIPEWQNESIAKAEKHAMKQFAESLGYTEQDLSSVVDHRLMVVLRDAMRYRQISGSREGLNAKVVRKTHKVLQPGAQSRRAPASERALRAAGRRVARSGRMSDAAAAIELLDG